MNLAYSEYRLDLQKVLHGSACVLVLVQKTLCWDVEIWMCVIELLWSCTSDSILD